MSALGFGRRAVVRVAAVCAAVCASGVASGQLDRLDPFGGEAEPPEPRVRMSLVSDHASIEGGQQFSLGVLFEIDEGWHIYWNGKNDTGYAPRFTIEAPEGFEVGEAAWPAPVRHVSPGDILDHVYEHTVTLVVPVKAPKTLERGDKVAFKVVADWLVCEAVCIPEEGEASLELRSGGAVKSGEKVLKLFAAARARTPKPAPESVWSDSGDAPFRVSASDSSPVLWITAGGARTMRFFPARDCASIKNLVDEGERAGDGVLLILENREAYGEVSGVVEIVRAGGSAFYTLRRRDGGSAEEP